ncbi:hypothetical protein AAFF_G00396850 [Aldrovandia affinis]|uniref:Uncharacterized protein n=1 Tax=Aldrovandia affinis TaxID=143900 RepID=A0AAD7WKJ9_9TELE|nr:hypothetical protein AAFF_G00396850 [Aldrovandia affinis]
MGGSCCCRQSPLCCPTCTQSGLEEHRPPGHVKDNKDSRTDSADSSEQLLWTLLSWMSRAARGPVGMAPTLHAHPGERRGVEVHTQHHWRKVKKEVTDLPLEFTRTTAPVTTLRHDQDVKKV